MFCVQIRVLKVLLQLKENLNVCFFIEFIFLSLCLCYVTCNMLRRLFSFLIMHKSSELNNVMRGLFRIFIWLKNVNLEKQVKFYQNVCLLLSLSVHISLIFHKVV